MKSSGRTNLANDVSAPRDPASTETVCVDGAEVTVRPIAISDVDRLARMFGRLSPESVRYRFFSPIPRLSRSALLRLACVDHCRRDALVALEDDEILAVARYDGLPGPGESGATEAEMAVTVEDAWQHRGLGRLLARRLAVLARARRCDAFVVRILPDNRAALGLVRKLVPDANVHFAGGDYTARLPFARPPIARPV